MIETQLFMKSRTIIPTIYTGYVDIWILLYTGWRQSQWQAQCSGWNIQPSRGWNRLPKSANTSHFIGPVITFVFALLQFSCFWYPLWLGRGFHLTSLKSSVVGNFFAETLVRHPHKPVVLKVPLQTSRISNSWELTGMQGSWGCLNMLKGKI